MNIDRSHLLPFCHKGYLKKKRNMFKKLGRSFQVVVKRRETYEYGYHYPTPFKQQKATKIVSSECLHIFINLFTEDQK